MITVPARLNVKEEVQKRNMDIFDFNLRCASPGIVVSFDEVKQTVVVQIAITERIRCDNPAFIAKHGSNVGVETIPLLVDVPICIPSAGDFSLTFPIQGGDECLVIFSDTCFDAWYQNGGIQDQMSLRRHDLSDAFAIMGIKSQPAVLPGYSKDTVQLRTDDGESYIEVTKDLKVNIVAPGDVNITTKNVKIDASGDVEINAMTTVKVVAPAGATIVGNVAVEGSLSTTLGLIEGLGGIDQVALQTHTHGLSPSGATLAPIPGT